MRHQALNRRHLPRLRARSKLHRPQSSMESIRAVHSELEDVPQKPNWGHQKNGSQVGFVQSDSHNLISLKMSRPPRSRQHDSLSKRNQASVGVGSKRLLTEVPTKSFVREASAHSLTSQNETKQLKSVYQMALKRHNRSLTQISVASCREPS